MRPAPLQRASTMRVLAIGLPLIIATGALAVGEVAGAAAEGVPHASSEFSAFGQPQTAQDEVHADGAKDLVQPDSTRYVGTVAGEPVYLAVGTVADLCLVSVRTVDGRKAADAGCVSWTWSDGDPALIVVRPDHDLGVVTDDTTTPSGWTRESANLIVRTH